MSFLFKAKISYEQFIEEAQKFKVPLKFYTLGLGLVTMYMLVPIGSSGLMYVYFCEETGDQEALGKIAEELKRIGFVEAESFELPLP
jgi:hypothetical protein